MKTQLLKIIILLLAIIPVFILPIIYFERYVYYSFSVLLVGLTVFSALRLKDIFSTLLFFSLVHISRPVNYAFADYINIVFPGSLYLIPIVAFTILILIIPSIRNSVSWWQKDKIDKKSVLLIALLSFVSGIGLIIWGKFIANDLSSFTDSLPKVSLFMIVVNGVLFASFNALAEEYLVRGMLMNGLQKLFSLKWTIIILQALFFSILHYYGFPGGIIGMIMVFAWSVVLGFIRFRTGGLFGVLIGHFFADLTIYIVLYSL